MSLTLLAIFLLPLCLKMVLDPSGMHKILKEWGNSRGLQFMSTVILLGLSMLIFLSSPVHFGFTWDSLLTWIAVLTAVKAIACLFPKVADFKVKLLPENRIPILGFLALIMILLLIYVDAQLL